MLDILIFIESLNCGGAERSLVSLLQMLDYGRVSVDLLLLQPNGFFKPYLPSQVRVIALDDAVKHKGIKNCMSHLAYSFAWRLQHALSIQRHKAETLWQCRGWSFPTLQKEYDVAIAYQQGLPTYYIAQKVKAKKKIAWINAELPKAGYRERFNSKFYEKYDNIVVVSQLLYELFHQNEYLNHHKLKLIYDIVNESLILKMAEKSANLEISSIKSLIVTVGRLEKPKNYLLAVETAKLLKSSGIDFNWIFVGEGSQRSFIESKISEYGLEDQIILAGLQENPYSFIYAADIYVQTSSFEGFGLTIAEAKILHKPIVSTNFTVVGDQIKDGKNGLIAEMTAESVAEKIKLLIEDHQLRKRIIDNLKNEHNLTSQTEIQKFYDLIK